MARRYPFVYIFLCTALCICSAYYLHLPWNLLGDTEADYLDTTAVYRVHILEPPVRKHNGLLMPVRLLSMQQHATDTIRPLSGQAMLFIQTDSSTTTQPEMGDILLVHTRIVRPGALFEGEFDYGNYLRLQHKVGIGYVRPQQCQQIGHVPVRGLRARATRAQQRLAQRFADAGLTGRPLAFVSAFTLGDKDELDSSLRQSFAAAGAAHILAVSGLHTGFIYIIVISLFTVFGLRRPLYEQRVRRVLLSIAIILTMWIYAFVTGLSPSVMRAVLMLTITQVGWMIRRTALSINTLAAAACICLWAEPTSLFSVSFQLSFAAVLGIMLFVPYMNRVWKIRGNKLQRMPRDFITVSIGAMIGTMPVTLYYFGQVAHYFLLANIVILLVAYLLVTLGLATLILAHTVVGTWLAFILQFVSGWVCNYVEWIEHLPCATLQMHTTPWMVVCLAGCIVFYYLSIHYKQLKWLIPSVAAVVCFCILHVHDTTSRTREQALTIRSKTLYYKHAGKIQSYPVTDRYTFFRYNQTDYVYAPYLSDYKRHALEQYCATHQIVMWQP